MRGVLLAAIAAVCSVGTFGAGAAVGASDFPVGYRDYHTYAELTTELHAELNLHTAGEYVLYPYSYTTAAVPGMRLVDHKAFVALAAGIAARNGYRPMQSSSRYIMDGTANDWSYARQGLLSMTVELAPIGGPRPFYPRDVQVGPDTQHNRAALLWWLAQAACPYAAAGLGCNMPLSPGRVPSS